MIKASAILKNGTIYFMQNGDGPVQVTELKGLKQGLYEIHIHDFGGNPFAKDHGGPDNAKHHVEDLENIMANVDGVAKIRMSNYEIALAGRCFVVFPDPDDLDKGGHDLVKTGNAGGRLACAVIEIVQTN